MLQEPVDLAGGWPLGEGDHPTPPRMLVPRASTRLDTRVLDERHSGAYHLCIYEDGVLTLVLPQHETTVLDPAAAFDLLDFLFAYRDLLAAQSAEFAERQAETPKEEE
jgi:hypothetical protein